MKRDFEKLEATGKKIFEGNEMMQLSAYEVADLMENFKPCITKDEVYEVLWKGIQIGAALGYKAAEQKK